MKERVIREGDENKYQPKIHSDRIHELYRVKQITGKAMTVIVDEALRQYIVQFVGTEEWRQADEAEERALDEYMENYQENMDRDMDAWEDESILGF